MVREKKLLKFSQAEVSIKAILANTRTHIHTHTPHRYTCKCMCIKENALYINRFYSRNSMVVDDLKTLIYKYNPKLFDNCPKILDKNEMLGLDFIIGNKTNRKSTE